MEEKSIYAASGKSRKDFVIELTSLLEHFNKGTVFEGIALKVYMILPSLLLQKPFRNSKAKDHQLKLTERLKLWNEGKIIDILEEGRNIQRHLKSARPRQPEDTARIFANLMLQGKVNSALKFLTEDHNKGGILPLTETVLGDLKEKHPEAEKIHPNTLL